MTAEDERKLFVAGLPDSITEDVLRQLFEATGGTVISVSLPRDRMTGRLRGFGFVTLSSAEEATAARSALDGSVQAGRPMSVRPFQSEAPRRGEAREGPGRFERSERAERGPREDRGDRTLYMGNLPYDCSVRDVEELFGERNAGPVARVHLPQGPDGRPRGFGFVTMSSPESANRALEALRDAELRGRRLLVNVAHPRGERPDRSGSDFRGGGGDRDRPGSGGDRPERPSRPPREPSLRPMFPDPGEQPPPFMESSKSEGRRRGERPEKKQKKRRKGTGGERSVGAPPKRGRDRIRDWEDWDDD